MFIGTLRKRCPYLELFWSAFSRIRTEYGVSLQIQSKCGKIRTGITLNTDTFHVVEFIREFLVFEISFKDSILTFDHIELLLSI